MAKNSRLNDLQVEGWDNLINEVKKIPLRLKRNELLKVLRGSTGPVVRAIKKRVPVKSGILKRSVGNITGRSKTFPNILVGYRKTKAFDRKGFDNVGLGTVTEFGTEERFTKGKKKKSTGSVKGKNIYEDGFNASKDLVIPSLEKKVAKMLERSFK